MLNNVLATAILTAAAVLAQSGLTIDTPSSLTQCQPVLVKWHNGQAPYIIKVIPGGQQSAPPLKTLSDNTNANELTWMVDLAPQEINIGVTDATGNTMFTAPVKINAGSSTACMNSTGNSTNVTPGQPGAGGGNTGGGSQTDGGAGGNTMSTDAGSNTQSGSAPATQSGSAPATQQTGGQQTGTTSQTGGANPPATSAPSASGSQTGTGAPPAQSSKPSSAMKLASVPAAAFVAAALYLSL